MWDSQTVLRMVEIVQMSTSVLLRVDHRKPLLLKVLDKIETEIVVEQIEEVARIATETVKKLLQQIKIVIEQQRNRCN